MSEILQNQIGRVQPVNLDDFEEIARKSIPKMAFDYYAGGAADEVTLAENRQAFNRLKILPRMLRDVSSIDLELTILGDQKVSMPILIAPTAFQCMAHPDGELATMRAAVRRQTVMVLSTLSTCSIEEVADEAEGNLWFQLYVYKDRGLTESLIRRAEAAGCRALVVTVDSPILGRRERDIRNGFHLPEGLCLKNLVGSSNMELPSRDGESGLAAHIASLYDRSVTWDSIEWFRSLTSLPLLVKGILRADDAREAVRRGVDGIIVSNHGGRQLDTVPAPISVLSEIVDAAGADLEIHVDGGFRRGTDVLKALALGARTVLIGRPVLWGLGAAGQEGVEKVLELLRYELELAAALAGASSLGDITGDLIAADLRRAGRDLDA